MSILRSEAIRQGQAILATLDDPFRVHLQANALGALQSRDDLEVRFVDDATRTASCSVAGGYRHDTTPPSLVIARSASTRRQHFTALHELGHHLQQNNLTLLQQALEATDPDALEEAACDAFAAEVLLPEDVVASQIGDRGPSASDVIALFEPSNASRAACCVRAAERLASPGAVFLLDDQGIVNFSIGQGMAPPARGSDQSKTPLVSAALRHEGRARVDTHISYRDGSTSDTLYGDCQPIEGWLVAVVVQDRAAWRTFAPSRPGTASRPGNWWTCEYCGEEFPTFGVDRCGRCGQPRCPTGHCKCTSAHEATCKSCSLTMASSLFAPGDDVCKECRGL